MFLRLVHGPGGWDALDQLEDEPREDEAVHVYRRVGAVGMVCIRGRGGGCYPTGKYRHVSDVDGESVRGTAAWRQWVTERAQSEGMTTRVEEAEG